MVSRAKYALSVTALLLCSHSQAWYFEEHRNLGESAFRQACTNLADALDRQAHNTSIPADEQTRYKENLNLLLAVPCKNIKADAASYGIWSALSGDHISEPEHFLSVQGELDALSWGKYGVLALRNHEHFWPDVKKTWRRNHLLAITHAKESRSKWLSGNTLEATKLFQKSIAYSAYADHFLQDAFSIGHMGFSRVNSQQNASLNFHDFWNMNGRWLKGINVPESSRDIFLTRDERIEKLTLLKRNDCTTIQEEPAYEIQYTKAKQTSCAHVAWYAFGDQKLNSPENQQNKEKILETNTAAITAVILAFLSDDDKGYSLIAESGFPVESQTIKTSKYHLLTTSVLQGLKPKKQVPGDRAWLGPTKSHLVSDCTESEHLVRESCWFNIESSYTEPAYPRLEVMATHTSFPELGGSFWGGRVSYGLYTDWVSGYLSGDRTGDGRIATAMKSIVGFLLPPSSRPYASMSAQSPDMTYDGELIDAYSEFGINYSLPNLHRGTVFSHDIDIALGQLRTDTEDLFVNVTHDIERGLYVGFNSNMDLKKAKITLSVGSLFPHSDIDSAELKIQAGIGWTFGAIGGGPIKRWSDQ